MELSLAKQHYALKAKYVDFFGWKMPLYYDSIIKEHLAIRQEVGIFDVSHMGNFVLSGQDAYIAINYLISNNLAKIKMGSAIYSPLLYENGTFVDDIIVYYESREKFYIIVNASNIQKDFEWMEKIIAENFFFAELLNLSYDYSLLAVQGKNSSQYIQNLIPEFSLKKAFEFQRLNYQGKEVIVAKTGYTGEEGVEILIPNQVTELFFEKALEQKIKPCGLGARDTLRIEKGYSLYGNEISNQYNAFEAGLGWTVSLDKDFMGKEALVRYRESDKPKKKITGFIMEERAYARSNQKIYDEEETLIGVVTSGCFSPSLKKNIGLGYIPRGYKANVIKIKIRDKFFSAQLHKRVFL